MNRDYDERTVPIEYILNMSIGIIFHTKEFKDKAFKKIISQVPRECFSTIQNSMNRTFMQLKTGTKIYFIDEYSIGHSRGLRFDRVFYERKPIHTDVLNIIKAQMTSRFFEPIKLEI